MFLINFCLRNIKPQVQISVFVTVTMLISIMYNECFHWCPDHPTNLQSVCVCADGGSELADSILSGRPLKWVPKPLECFCGSGHLGLPSEAVLQPLSALLIQISGPERKRLDDHWASDFLNTTLTPKGQVCLKIFPSKQSVLSSAIVAN